MSINRQGIPTPIGCASRIQKTITQNIQPVPNEKEIIKDYFYSLEFFKERENYHQDAASWYFNYARAMEAKAHHHLDLAESAYVNRGHYRDLLVMAELKRIGGRAS